MKFLLFVPPVLLLSSTAGVVTAEALYLGNWEICASEHFFLLQSSILLSRVQRLSLGFKYPSLSVSEATYKILINDVSAIPPQKNLEGSIMIILIDPNFI